MQPSAQPEDVRPAGQFEFDSQQNRVIQDLASSMRWVAAPMLVLGVLYLVTAVLSVIQAFRDPAHLFPAIYLGLGALLVFAFGRWTDRASTEFGQIVTSSGKDISHLMEALNNLRKMYGVMSFFVKIYVALIFIALIVAVVVMIMHGFGKP